jgi:glutamine cyclotransferase
MVRRVLLTFPLGAAAFLTAAQQPDPYEAGRRLLREGKPREAIEALARVDWTSPHATAARRLLGEIATRGSLGGGGTPVERVEIAASFPHDATCYTQGLEVDAEQLVESCGLYGRSRVRRIDIRTGRVAAETPLAPQYFAEGLTQVGGRIFLLTWMEGVALVFDPDLSGPKRSFPYRGEGWGLTHDADGLISSDGSNELRFLDPETGRVRRTVKVFDGDLPVMNLNELEYVDGAVLANVYMTDRIARIDPRSGKLLGWIVAEGLLSDVMRARAEVLNGIAWDPRGKRLFLTGKLWPTLFEVRLKPVSGGARRSP